MRPARRIRRVAAALVFVAAFVAAWGTPIASATPRHAGPNSGCPGVSLPC